MEVAGAPTAVQTLLVAALEPAQAERIDRLRRVIGTGWEQIMRLLKRFGLNRIDIGQIANRIAAASGSQRKVLARNARQLGELVQLRQRFMAELKIIGDIIEEPLRTAEIQVHERLHAGVRLRMGELQHTVSEELGPTQFTVRRGELAVHRQGSP